MQPGHCVLRFAVRALATLKELFGPSLSAGVSRAGCQWNPERAECKSPIGSEIPRPGEEVELELRLQNGCRKEARWRLWCQPVTPSHTFLLLLTLVIRDMAGGWGELGNTPRVALAICLEKRDSVTPCELASFLFLAAIGTHAGCFAFGSSRHRHWTGLRCKHGLHTHPARARARTLSTDLFCHVQLALCLSSLQPLSPLSGLPVPPLHAIKRAAATS